jgi:hypothetical protein
MTTLTMDRIDLLSKDDKSKVSYLTNLLFQKKQYDNLRVELEQRRDEIKKGERSSHKEIWHNINV